MLLPGWEGSIQWTGLQISLKNVLGRLAVATVEAGCLALALKPGYSEGTGLDRTLVSCVLDPGRS